MMSPRLPLHLLTYARRARRLRVPALAVAAACAATMATAATPVASAGEGSEQRSASRAWNPFFEQLRPVAAIDPRRVIVTFDDPSLGDWVGASERRLGPGQQRAWLRAAKRLQQKRLDTLSMSGVQFTVEHRYVRVLNGASLVVHGDGAQLLRSAPAVTSVVPVRTIWPTATTSSMPPRADDAGAAGAAAVGGSPASGTPRSDVRVAVLDAGVDAAHPALSGRIGQAFDATKVQGAKAKVQGAKAADVEAHPHATAMAGTVLRAAGEAADIEVLPVRVLTERPARDGVEALLGDSDDLLAGLEYAVDPNADGNAADAADVALVASTAPYAGFAGSPEDRAAQAADALGTVVVAAAGNDGASGDDVGTVGSLAASNAALVVGAVDLRGHTPAADVRVHGGGIDETFEGAPILTAGSNRLPKGSLSVVVVDEAGGEVVDYLDAELRSRVSGAVALVATREGVTIAAQVRAAADAGAIAVLVASDDADAAAGTIDVRGADIPAIGLDRGDARALRDAMTGGDRLALSLRGTSERNPAFGEVAGFSSAGPRLDGIARPDVVAPGVGMQVPGAAGGWSVSSGTSVAAAWAAGEVAALRDERPSWDAATVRAALLGSALALGEAGDRPAVRLQGAGLVDADRAAGSDWIAGSGRIEFGSVTRGTDVRRALDLRSMAGADAADLEIRVDDGGADAAVKPTLAGDELLLAVAKDAPEGHVGGWLVLPQHDLRIPWTATVVDPAKATVPVNAQLTNEVLRAVAGPGAFGSTLTLAIGGNAEGGTLGLAAVQKLEVRLVDAAGRDRGAIGGLDQALPGVYTFGLTGLDAKGARLKAGAWQLKVRYVPAADPAGDWREGPTANITVRGARRAK